MNRPLQQSECSPLRVLQVGLLVVAFLRERFVAAHVAWGRQRTTLGKVVKLRSRHVVGRNHFAQRLARNGARIRVDFSALEQLAENGGDAACARYVFDVILLCRWRHFADAGDLAREAIDIGHRKIHLTFARHGQQV